MNQIARQQQPPIDPATGLTLPLSNSLDSQSLDRHRAMIGLELEVISEKMDRFGWDRNRGSATQARILTDWMDALQDYPLSEIREACKRHLIAEPKTIPNEGHIIRHLRAIRREKADRHRARRPEPEPACGQRERVSPDAAAKILEEAGFRPRKFPQ